MYHTLKCFEDGTAGNLGFPCGEWDYLTYNYLFEHTGQLDSTALQHPLYLLDNADFVSADLIAQPRFNYLTLTYPALSISAINNINDVMVGSADGTSEVVFNAPAYQHRFQTVYTAEELQNAGLSAGPINRLTFMFENAGSLPFARMKMGNRADFSFDGFDNGTFTTVFEGDLSFAPGAQTIALTTAFDWDGTSDILLEIATFGDDTGMPVAVQTQEVPESTVFSGGALQQYMEFNGNDQISVPPSVFAAISDEVTIAFWIRGDAAAQPENGTVFEGVNSANNRVLNSHLPWSNSRVYWDAGWDGGYDRIDKAAVEANFEGQWNHWAFTKNNVTGDMKIYLNGALWHSGSNFDNSMAGIVKFTIGAASSWTNYYRGDIDDFRIFSSELSETEIAEMRSAAITPEHPLYSEMLINYTFDDETGALALNGAEPTADGVLNGSPQRRLHMPWNLGLTHTSGSSRPVISFGFADYTVESVNSGVDIPVPADAVILSEWEVVGNSVQLVQANPYWLPGNSLYYYENGIVYMEEVDTNPVTTFTNETLNYFGVPYEVINRFELGRYITPYGIQLDLEDGWTWVFDVTDYEPLLHGEVELEAGNWQELLDLKFVFIEGTPERDVQRVETLWSGSFGLGNFESQVGPVSVDVEEGEEMFRLKTRASGHGFGTGNNCAEFCYNLHSVKVNGNTEWTWEIMQECADNPLYPQGGTWIYDRAAWCPGAPVTTQDLELTPLVTGDSFEVDYDVTYDPYGNYVFEGQLVTYGAPNHQNDVELDWIIAPSDWKIMSRVNPICDEPVIRIRNLGEQTLTSATITYQAGGTAYTMEWTGNLPFLATEEVTLLVEDPSFWSGSDEELNLFQVEVYNPNGVDDENPSNNAGTSHFRRPPIYTYGEGEDDDNRLIVWTKTNGAPWETEVLIQTLSGDTVFFRDDYSQANTNYQDTIQLNAGCYRALISDSDDDGLSFFANNDGNGYVRFKEVAGPNFISFEPDFGKEIIHYFQFVTGLTSVNEWNSDRLTLSVYPNPGHEYLEVKLGGWKEAITWSLVDMNGKTVSTGVHSMLQGNRFTISAESLSSGLYMLVVSNGKQRSVQRWMKE
ncbi:MAG: hypothetical protein RL226_2142 [Bacteroidota bacterium]